VVKATTISICREGSGDDMLKAFASIGNDVVRIDAESGKDAITYDVSEGNDQVFIDGGRGYDTLTINKLTQNYTVYDARGRVIHREGTGGTAIRVRDIENIIYQ